MKTNSTKSHVHTKRYIGLSFVSLITVLITICIFSYVRVKQIQDECATKLLFALERLELVNKLLENKELSQSLLKLHVDTKSPDKKDEIQVKLLHVLNENQYTIERLNQLLQEPERKKYFEQLKVERAKYSLHANTLLNLSNNNNLEEAQEYKRIQLAPFYNKHQILLININNSIAESVGENTKNLITVFANVVNEAALLLLFAIVAAVGTGITLIKVFSRLQNENKTLNSEITERNQLQSALLESQNQYKRLFNSNPLPMLVYDQNSLKILEVNEAAVQEYGYSKEEFLSMDVTKLRAKSDIEKFLLHIQSLDKSADASSTGVTHKRKDGSLFKVELKSHALPKQVAVYPRMVVVVNVQQREEFIEQLQKSEKLLREISSSIPGAVFQYQIDKSNNITFNFISEGIRALHNLTPEQVYKNKANLFSNVHLTDLRNIKHEIVSAMQTLSPWQMDYRVWNDKQNNWKWVRGHGLPTPIHNETILYNGTLSDITVQKEMQFKLKASEAQLCALLDSSQQAVFLLDENLCIIKFNAIAASEVKTYLLKELTVGQSILEFVVEEQVPHIVRNHAKALQGETLTLEINFGDFYYEIIFRPVFAEDKHVIAVSLVISNISAHKNAIKTIQHNEAQLARAQQLAKLGNWEHNLQTGTIIWSDSIYEIFGKSKEDFIPTETTILACIHPADKEYYVLQTQKALQEKSVVAFEYRILLLDGSEKNIFQIVEFNSNSEGVVTKASGSVQDITERKNTEKEITQAKNLLQSTLENIPEIIFSADVFMKLTYISPQSLEITGYTEEELLKGDTLWLEYVHPEDKALFLGKVVPNLANGLKQQCDMRMIVRNGETKWLLLRISPMKNEDDKIIRFDGSAADITDYKLAEAKRNELTEQLIRQNKNLQQFNFIVSHNLRAPIANILGLTSIFDFKHPDAPINQRVINNLQESAELLDTTVRDLNEILTIRNQPNTAAMEMIAFNEIITNILKSISDKISNTNVEIEYNFDEAPTLLSVRSYVYSIILNLVTNAIKYKSPKRNLKLQLKTSKHCGYICLSVSDNGRGIDLAKVKDKVFGLYKRFHSDIKGRGIGLHLVKTQAEILGGKVEVESQVDIGTTFKIFFKV